MATLFFSMVFVNTHVYKTTHIKSIRGVHLDNRKVLLRSNILSAFLSFYKQYTYKTYVNKCAKFVYKVYLINILF